MKGPRGAPQAHNFLNIPLIAFRSNPKIARLRYFGTNTTWYLQYHLTCERLCHSLMTVSFLVNLAVHVGRPSHICTP